MIRAVIEDGHVRPIDPLPAEWRDGRELTIEEARKSRPATFEQWQRQLEHAIAEVPDDEEDWQRIQQALSDADRVAKVFVRREMGLDG